MNTISHNNIRIVETFTIRDMTTPVEQKPIPDFLLKSMYYMVTELEMRAADPTTDPVMVVKYEAEARKARDGLLNMGYTDEVIRRLIDE